MNKTELDVERLRFGDSNEDLANFLGISPTTLSLKRTGRSEFTQPEMKKIKSRYKLSDERFMEIFFTD